MKAYIAMERSERVDFWKAEEETAQMIGWDFSHIHGRYTEETDLPWDYETIVRKYMKKSDRLLDIDTGGGEFLMKLDHPSELTACTEGYPPNVALCQKSLLPKGYDFRMASDPSHLPFAAAAFDIIINRHGEFDHEELRRLLKPGGFFITQQVGSQNDRELIELILPEGFTDTPGNDFARTLELFKEQEFDILEQREAFRPIRFWDVGALVWYAKIIEWEFPNFSVDRSLDRLCEAQAIIDNKGEIQGRIHRFYLVARKR